MRLLAATTAFVLAIFAVRTSRADPSTTSPQQGYDLGEIWMPRGVALADAQVALGTSTAALYNNPGSMPFARTYHFEALASVSPEARRQSYGGAVVDSFGRFSGGFGGTWTSQDPDGINRQWVDLRWASAIGIGDKLGIGAGGRFLRVTQDVGKGPLGPSAVSDGTPKGPVFNVPTFDIGMTFAPIPQIRIGAVGKNLTNAQNALVPVTFASGVGIILGIFSAEADVLVDFNTWSARAAARISTGAEVFLFDRVPVRLGYRFDQGQRTHALGWGLGWVDKKFSVELSARRDIVADAPMMVIVLGLRYFYDPGASDANEGQALAKSTHGALPIGM
jgi:hypothetical protein